MSDTPARPPSHALHICPDCQTRAMQKEVSGGHIKFRCPCGTEKEGTRFDRLIASSQTELRASDTQRVSHAQVESFATLVNNAARDRTGLKVPKKCEGCGLPYMTQLRIGADETVVHVCSCGHQD